MIYYKNKNNDVYAYQKSDLEQVERITELELLLRDKESSYIDASNEFVVAENELEKAQSSLNDALARAESEEDEESKVEYTKEIETLTLLVDSKESEHEDALNLFNNEKEIYQPLKDEYDAILPVFFDIRENLKVMKKMTPKEVDMYLNPPVSKEQLIAEAEQQKQSLLAEANNAIAPLQDAVDLDMATDEEVAQLTAWKKYRVLLNRVDTSTAPDINWPEKP